jgi:hypothetical protein
VRAGAAGQRRKARPRVEALEGRALLSGLSITLTTNKSVYQAGEPIKMTFTETNTGSQPVNASDGPSVDGFDVTENGKAVWQSNAGVNPLFILLITLQPGQSHTLTATWDGVPSEGHPPVLSGGDFTVTNQLDPNGASASFKIDAPLSYSITTDKGDYSVGQPIEITDTETNTSNQPVTVNTGPSDFAITQEGLGTPLANVPGTWGAQSGTETLQPGQSISETATWNGVSNVGSLRGTNVWNDISVSNPTAPQGLVAVFQIDNPVVTSLIASSPSFAPDQPVTLTFTETNSAGVPVAVDEYPGSFSIENLQTNAVVFSQTGSGSPTAVTLQPGGSLTQTATWTPSTGQAPAGSYSAQYSDSTQGASTSFQIGSSLVASLATARSVVRLGQPTAFTLTLSNHSNKRVDVTPETSADALTILRGSHVVWRSSKLTLRGHKTIAAGQSIKLRGIWSGNARERVESRLAPGTYTIEVSYDGYTASKTIQIKG